ncbi:hypothetical protein [uncultured Amnibacterium sp.]|uniref:hypothetical protein n=1 Tax=uncultured Amnibacterium sp. TaxID=1631851 RepID=UPI0035CA060D
MSEIRYHRSSAELWRGFSPDQALDWTRVLRMHWPSWPGATAMWLLSTGLQEGKPAGLPDWVERARQAELAGFTPQRYDRLHRALDAVPAVEHPSHPDNAPDPRWPVHLIRLFDAAMWADWPWLIGSGWKDEEAVRLLLTAKDLLR